MHNTSNVFIKLQLTINSDTKIAYTLNWSERLIIYSTTTTSTTVIVTSIGHTADKTFLNNNLQLPNNSNYTIYLLMATKSSQVDDVDRRRLHLSLYVLIQMQLYDHIYV